MIQQTARQRAIKTSDLPATANTPADAGKRWQAVPHHRVVHSLIASLRMDGWLCAEHQAFTMHNGTILAWGCVLANTDWAPPPGYNWGLAVTWANDRRHKAKLYGGMMPVGGNVGIPLTRLGEDYPSTTLARLCKHGWDIGEARPIANLGQHLCSVSRWMLDADIVRRPRDVLFKACEAKLLPWARMATVANGMDGLQASTLYQAFCKVNAASPPDLQMARAMDFLDMLRGKKAA